jgi:hypothetical protein
MIDLSSDELLQILDLFELAQDIDRHAVTIDLYEKIEDAYEIAQNIEG